MRGGLIVSVGPVDEPAAAVLNAEGLMVAPGFVDLHTHYDAQLAWDPTASPSPLHGVTTVIGGNCGFGLAPSGPEHADYLMRLMARVEGLPLEALSRGLSWDWSTFGDWLGTLEGRIGVNAGFLVGHSALRRVVMGDAATDGPDPGSSAGGLDPSRRTAPEWLDAMVAELHAALAAGALGWSTSQSHTHKDGDGAPVPSRLAGREELLVLAGAVAGHEGTTVELIMPGCLNGFSPAEAELMAAMSAAARRPANWNVLAVTSIDPDGWRRQLDVTESACRGMGEAGAGSMARGGPASGGEAQGRVVALTLPYGMSVRLSFLTGAVLDGLPGWSAVLGLPVEERLAALGDPEVRRRMAAGASSPDAGILALLAQWHRLQIIETFSPANAGLEGRRVGSVARERGVDAFDALLDTVVADGLRTGLRPPMPEPTAEDWRLRAESWLDPRTVVGGSDAGAHLDMMCGAAYTTALLASVREQQTVSWEEAVRQLSDVPARLYGLRDRGRLLPGWRADLVLFDPSRVGPGPERTLDDLPGGTSRIYAESHGVEHVLVNGVAVVRDGVLTGAVPGTLLRSGRDTETVVA